MLQGEHYIWPATETAGLCGKHMKDSHSHDRLQRETILLQFLLSLFRQCKVNRSDFKKIVQKRVQKFAPADVLGVQKFCMSSAS